MFRLPRIVSATTAAILTLAAAARAQQAAEPTYLQPPKTIVDILDRYG